MALGDLLILVQALAVLIQLYLVVLVREVQVALVRRQMPLERPLALSILALVDLLILVRVLVDLIQVILQILTRHSLVEVWLRVRQALPVQEQARLILRLVQRLIQVL